MKKIMIAAAAVAMASSVFAAGYTFTATLKTTSARMGVSRTNVLNLGVNARGEFWYADARVANIPEAYLKFHDVKGHNVRALRKTLENKGTVEEVTNRHPLYLLDANDGNYDAVIAIVTALSNEYNQRSAGVYCDSIRVFDDAACYRIAGTKRISVTFIEGTDLTDCCDVAAAATVVRNGDQLVYDNTVSTQGVNPTQIGYVLSQWGDRQNRPEVNSTLYQRFGSQRSETANSVEMFARVVRSVTTDGALFSGWIAGQGTTLTAGQMAPRMVMGNIVGALEAPRCPNCCWRPDPSTAFDCVLPGVAQQLPLTAAYGTFQLMYNANLR